MVNTLVVTIDAYSTAYAFCELLRVLLDLAMALSCVLVSRAATVNTSEASGQ